MAPLLLSLPLRLRPIPAGSSTSRIAPRPRSPRPFPRRRLHLPALLQVQCLAGPGPATPAPAPPPRWHAALSAAAGLYPAYVAAGACVAVARPAAFRWFVALAPGSYTATLGFIMLAMGLTLQLRDFAALLRDRPLAVRDRIRIPSRSIFPRAIVIGYPNGGLVDPTRCFSVLLQILFGCAAQYTIMPAFGAIVSLALGLPPSLSAGLILLACCPGGTASNVVRLSTEPSLSHSQFCLQSGEIFFFPFSFIPMVNFYFACHVVLK